MDFEPPADDDPRRAEVRAWLAGHPDPSPAVLHEAGYVVPHWPAPWGLSAEPMHQLVIGDELDRAGVKRPVNPIGIGWAGPTILAAGTPEQQQRWLPPLLTGEEIWCQLFSEPDAGSDLANLRTTAVRDGDTWVINGSKIWSSGAHLSRWGILLARTDPDAPKHKGISYFVLPMNAPGVEVQPLLHLTGKHDFNQCFFTDVRIPADHLIGAEGEGWRLANVTLANERVSLSTGGVLWGMGPTTDQFFAVVRAQGGIADPHLRQEAARVYSEGFVLRLLGYRVLTAAVRGDGPGPEVSVKKAKGDVHGQRLMALAARLAGAEALTAEWGPLGADAIQPWGTWQWGSLFSRALTIGGGTTEVQKGIIGERLLGLPREPRPLNPRLNSLWPGGLQTVQTVGSHGRAGRSYSQLMRLSMQLSYSGGFKETAAHLRDLEAAGLDIVWVAEAYSFDAISQMGYLAAVTDTLQIASGIINVYGRTATTIAMTMAGLDYVSDGRAICGLGASGPQVIEGFHGVPYDKPMTRIREYIEVCRMVWRREKLVFDGATVKVPLPEGEGTGLGKPLKIINHPVRDRIPVWWASLMGNSVAATAEVADGWLPVMFMPERMRDVWGDDLDRGLAKRSPDLGPLEICAGGLVAIGDDLPVEKLRDAARPMHALYIGGMGARGKNFYNTIATRSGFEAEAKEIQDLYLDGHKDEAAAKVPVEFLEKTSLIGPRSYVAERIAAYKEAGVTVLSVQPTGDPVKTIAELKELVS